MLKIETNGTVTYDRKRIGEVVLDNPGRDYLYIGGILRQDARQGEMDDLLNELDQSRMEASQTISGLNEEIGELEDELSKLKAAPVGRDKAAQTRKALGVA